MQLELFQVSQGRFARGLDLTCVKLKYGGGGVKNGQGLTKVVTEASPTLNTL